MRILGEQPVGQRLQESPARTASASPNTAHAVGRCLRVVSRSITSSCSRVKLCTSSTAAAARTAVSCCPPSARTAASTSAGRIALPEFPAAGLPSACSHPKW